MTNKQHLESKGFTVYADDEVLESATIPKEKSEITFFTVGKYITDDELEQEYKKRGLVPADIMSIAESGEDKDCIGTHWKDAKGNWCCATFRRWVGERGVRVYRRGSDWSDRWWFAGVRKSTQDSDTQSSLSLELEKAIKVVKDAGYQVSKIM